MRKNEYHIIIDEAALRNVVRKKLTKDFFPELENAKVLSIEDDTIDTKYGPAYVNTARYDEYKDELYLRLSGAFYPHGDRDECECSVNHGWVKGHDLRGELKKAVKDLENEVDRVYKKIKARQKKKMNESADDGDNLFWNEYACDYDEGYIFRRFQEDPERNTMWLPLIDPVQYKQALNEFMKYGKLIRFPAQKIFQWMGTCLKNTSLLLATTAIYGHSSSCDVYEFVDEFFEGDWDKFKEWCDEHGEDDDWAGEYAYLEERGFIDWSDSGTDTPPFSDYGLSPLIEIAAEYDDSKSPEETLVLINRMLDVYHQRGDLAALFVKGGSSALYNISNN